VLGKGSGDTAPGGMTRTGRGSMFGVDQDHRNTKGSTHPCALLVYASVCSISTGSASPGSISKARWWSRTSRCGGVGWSVPGVGSLPVPVMTPEGWVSRWRGLDLGRRRVSVRATLRRLRCPTHGVLVEGVPFARAGSRFNRDFEDLIAYLATKADKTTITRLRLGCPDCTRANDSAGGLVGRFRL